MTKRNETPKELQKVGDPSWLAEFPHEEDHSLDDLKKHVILPLFKVVQSQSDPELKKDFGEGSIIISPTRQLVAKIDEHFLFLPILFYDEYCRWSDIKDKEQATIIERSFDPSSEVGKRARSKADQDRYESYSDGRFKYRYVHHLNFVGLVYSGELAGTEVILSFSRGEFGTGQRFGTAISLRRYQKKRVPLWAQIWQLYSADRSYQGYNWKGIDFKNPEDHPYIILDKDEALAMKQIHEDMKESLEKNLLVADRQAEAENMKESRDSDMMSSEL